MSGSQLDASIPLRAVAPPPINPLALFNQAAEAQGNALNVQGRQRALAAQTAEQQAYAGARNPDGTYDPARLQAGLSQLPAGAGAAVSQGQALTTAQFGFNTAQQARIAGTVGSLLSQDDSQQTAQAYQAVLRQELAAGTINQSHYDNAISNMPQPNAPPGAFRAYGTRMLVGTLGGPEMANTVLPRNEDVDRGGVIQPTVRQPAVLGGARTLAPGVLAKSPAPQFLDTGGEKVPTSGGVPTGAPAIPNTTSPETRAALVQIPDPDHPGAFLYAPRSSLPGSTGAPVGAPAGATGAPSPQGHAVPAGAVSATADPNVLAKNAEDVKAYQADQLAVPQINTDLQNLQTARAALALTRTGRSTGAIHDMYSFLKAQGVEVPWKNNDDITQYDIARKAMLSFAASQGKSAGTDLGLESQIHSNASPDIDQGASNHVITQQIGLRRQRLAQILEAPPGGVGHANHVSTFTTATDPRGFAFDSQDPAERDAMIAKMTGPERTKYYKSVGIASRRGLLNPQPAAQAPPTAASPDAPPAPVVAPGF